MSGRSTVERLPLATRDAVDAAIADGAITDELVALIREHGGSCSRSAVGRYAKRTRNVIGKQREAARIDATVERALGDSGTGRADQCAIATLRTMTLLSAADLGDDGEPVPSADVARLALALRRIEDADRHRAERQLAEAEAAAQAERAKRKPGLSAETVAAMNRAILYGITE